ncbi:MAG: MFS transporter [Chloroflexi bacterium]|nr:MFS transporter [Chloroflexota bacterium]
MERLPLPAKFVRPLGYPKVSDLPRHRQEGLRAFWLDGLFASLAGGFADPYYTLYMLSLSATNAQIGLVNTLTQLIGATMAIPGSAIADRTGRYKSLSLLAGLMSRSMWLVMLISPWILSSHHAVWGVLVAWVAIAGFDALGVAAWTALSADLVPVRLRGGYFASRNIIMQVVRLLAIPFAGIVVDQIGEPDGYQVGLGIAFLVGAVSLFFFSQVPEHIPSTREDRISTWQVVRQARHLPVFTRFLVSHSVLMLGVMIGGPFINVYLVEEAGFSVGTIGFVTTVGVLATMVGMRIMARLYDRLGMIRSMWFGVAVPLIPVVWLWVRHPWEAYIVSILAALTWTGYNLGAFNLLLASTPDEHRPRYIAVYTTVISMVGATGPLLGGWLLDATDFGPVMSLSTIVRALGLILFLALVREPKPVEADRPESA